MSLSLSLSERLDLVPPSGIRRLFEVASRYPDAISLGIGEPDFETPAHIRSYAKEALDLGYTHYTPNSGLQMLRDALAEKLRKENSIEADPDRNIMVTVGANQAVTLALAAFLRAGEEVLIPSPCFVTHKAAVTIAGGNAVDVATDEQNGFEMTFESLSRAVTKKTRCILINSPNNPTGAVLSRKRLEEVATVAVEHDLRVISDEVYESLVYDDHKHVSIASLEGMADRTITINGFSKVYAMTGWRLGYLAADQASVEKMVKLQMYLDTCPVAFAQYAAAKALGDPRSRMAAEAMRIEYQRRRDRIYDLLKGIPQFSVSKPMGAFYVFPGIGVMDDQLFSEAVLEKAHVALVPGSAFGAAGKGHVRIAYTVAPEGLEEAMARITRALPDILGRGEPPHT